MTITEYDPDNPKGWVIRSERELPSGKASVSWWFGPKSGWGTTYGSLHLDRERYPTTLEVAVFPTKAAAEAAYRSQYGRTVRSAPGDTAQRLSEALKEAR